MDHFNQALKEGAALWEIPFDLDQYDEDNDTEEESSDEEEVESIDEVVLGPERGIKFYMRQEAKEEPSHNPGQVSEIGIKLNEYVDPNREIQPGPFLEEDKEQYEEAEDSEEDFEWFEDKDDDCYFVMVNKDRRTVKKGEQVFYCYGDRNNRFLMQNYGFCYPNNNFDSLSVLVRYDVDLGAEFEPSFIDMKIQSILANEIRFKRDQINQVLLAFFRLRCRKSYYKGKP